MKLVVREKRTTSLRLIQPLGETLLHSRRIRFLCRFRRPWFELWLPPRSEGGQGAIR